MFKSKVDEFYSASPTPGENSAQEDEVTVVISRDDLALLKEVKRFQTQQNPILNPRSN